MALHPLNKLLEKHCSRFKGSEYDFKLLCDLYEAAGFEIWEPSSGSHWTVFHPNLDHPDYPQKTIGIPVHGGKRGGRTVKAIYFKKACQIIKYMLQTEAIKDEQEKS